MRSIGEGAYLIALSVWVFLRKLLEESKVRRRFYSNKKFYAIDHALKNAYRGINPYRISKQFLLQRGEKEVDVYGETPLTTLFKIADECNITALDHVLEIGAGRGRGAFFLSHYIGCKVLAIEWIPSFVKIAKELSEQYQERVAFLCQDVLDVEIKSFSVVYLCGTSFSDAFMQKLAQKLEDLLQGSSVISVSFPLSDYSTRFVVIKKFTALFLWGEAEIFLQKRI